MNYFTTARNVSGQLEVRVHAILLYLSPMKPSSLGFSTSSNELSYQTASGKVTRDLGRMRSFRKFELLDVKINVPVFLHGDPLQLGEAGLALEVLRGVWVIVVYP